jgi:DNA-binding GntR family transcriptional regulator
MESAGPPLNLDDQAYARIRAMIVDGALLPGARVVPEQLARDMGISRTPMLSALKRLYQEGLVDWQSRRGIYIRQPSPTELAQIFELREVMEGLVARRAATSLSPARIDGFAALFANTGTEETAQNRRLYLQRDYQFHAALLEAAGSPPLTAAVEAMNIMVSAFSGGLIRTIREGLDEHEAVLAALRRRDPDAAEAAMRLHIRRSVDRLYRQAEERAPVRRLDTTRTIKPHRPARPGSASASGKA